MEPITALSTALAAFRTTIDLAKFAVGAHDDLKLAEVKQMLNEQIFEITNAALQLQEKHSAARDEIDALKDDKRKLSAQIAQLEERSFERAKYDLHELSQGVFVLAEVQPSEPSRGPHYLCQPCMDNETKKVVLQLQQKSGRINLVCNHCDSVYFTGRTYQIDHRALSARLAGGDM
ncbi:hypothetical protein PCA20602_02706 [Pandoraea capi]|uniref:Uncharacterized protein n=1 Tax=Pandoraea capi TaxID=2508286 RepID=A0ABY6W396_9BURK|nr:hypothetical protein [Pandoraea capi]VVE12473.1 hypothetical protein PCA20602_02706 [Pandoraea capi]